ncbi:unnamed protein product [Bemisia tabaci]|uniref:Uncharacterized protein n=2 Tax=Bemisia tabaci TaxID=7038 RepID=A0A9P0APD8_BEMTA|nr:unnamed protein product [Bemisia tabaci]
MSFTCGLARLLSGPPPVISMTTAASDDFAEEPLGSVTHLSFVPSMYGHYTDRMNLWQRLENWVSQLYLMRKFRDGLESVAGSYFRENFGPEKEGLVDGCWNCASM